MPCSTPCGIKGLGTVWHYTFYLCSLWCSTPCGIKGLGTPYPLSSSSQYPYRAQRLVASKVWEHTSQAESGDLETRAQRLVASKVWELGWWVSCSYSQSKCSTPCGIKGLGTDIDRSYSVSSTTCSTPCGIKGLGTCIPVSSNPLDRRAQRLVASKVWEPISSWERSLSIQ